MHGFIVTWDVDSGNAALCSKLRRFVFGQRKHTNGREYAYRGFVDQEGVRYLGQSVLFVATGLLPQMKAFLRVNGIEHFVIPADLGRISPS